MSDSISGSTSAGPAGGEGTFTEGDMGVASGGVAGGGPLLRPDAPVSSSAAVRHVGPPPGGGPGSPVGAPQGLVRPSDDYGVEPHRFDPVEDKRAERRVALVFVVSALFTLGFVWAYIFMKIHTASYGAQLNYVLGATLAMALLTLGAGQVMWAKSLIPHEYAVQDRHDGASSEADRDRLEKVFFAGADQLGIGRRSLARRTLLLAAGVFPLAGVVLLRDLGPAPEKKLRHTAWRPGSHLVDVETRQRIRQGDIRVGAIVTVLPEGYEKLAEEDWATSPTILIRMRPEENKPVKGRANWSVNGHVAYSKICTHVGCPTSLYEQQTKHLLCPCHQSSFLVTEGCRVIFGPAARALPQLPIAVDSEGYFYAQSDYREPVGPSFWERG